ncbi:MAG: hypothetical protein ATN31_06785 [Candidatus Epulonipiscioides saccharophilum]|nr:MAG: hypothetical protein ATN31_06785 [Epulopiscium sp. AS2M-Bin001]
MIGDKVLKKVMKISTVFFLSMFMTIAITASSRLIPIYSVNTDQAKVALTFDVAWGGDDFEQILAILDDNQVKATFFIVGDWIDKYPDKVKLLKDKGHDIANHSNSHPHVTKLSVDEIKEDIQAAHKKVRDLLGIEMDLYRAPYGEYNNDVITAANELGYHTIQWDVDSLDWKDYTKEELVANVLEHSSLQPGSIILFHTGTKYTKDILDETIKGLKNLEYELIPVSELIIRQDYFCDFRGRQYKQEVTTVF